MSLPVLIISGTIGVGKSTAGLAVHELLESRKQPHAFLDLDRLTDSYPKQGRFNDEVMFKALTALWPIYKSFGAERLVLARVVEDLSELESYKRALGECTLTVVLLRASEDVRLKRISDREVGESRNWHLDRSTELDQILNKSSAFDSEVDNDRRDPAETAREILEKARWIPSERNAIEQHDVADAGL